MQDGDVTFKLTPSEGYTNQEVTVEIVVNIEMQENILQYSTDGVIWKSYKETFTVEQNGTIYARLVNELYEVGEAVPKEIKIIDKEPPVGEISSTVDYNSIMISIINVSDQASEKGEASGIKGYSYCIDGGNFTDITESNQKTFSNLAIGSEHSITVRIIDNADNCKEISSKIKTRMPNYIVKNGTLVNGVCQYNSTAAAGGHSQQNGFRRIAMRTGPEASTVGGFDVNCSVGNKMLVIQLKITSDKPSVVEDLIAGCFKHTWTGFSKAVYGGKKLSNVYNFSGNYQTLPTSTGGIKTYRFPITAAKADGNGSKAIQIGFASVNKSGADSFSWTYLDIYNMYLEE